MNLFVVGVGLIGGSFALDFKAVYEDAVIYGIDTSDAHLEEALALRIIDEKATLGQLDKADVVLVAVPVDATVTLLPEVLDKIHDDTLVMDVGSTKWPVCMSVAHHPRRRNFLAAHPVSGTEFSGPKAAHRGLYEQKTNIICEVEKTAFKLQERALEIFNNLGMRIRYMDPKAHDKHIAYVSHLSHISSFMLGKTVME
ncbi:MAG: prephenate dehydrogenase/arogenate dehydrogenase family protein, partial [Bacteroidota bacterium]